MPETLKSDSELQWIEADANNPALLKQDGIIKRHLLSLIAEVRALTPKPTQDHSSEGIRWLTPEQVTEVGKYIREDSEELSFVEEYEYPVYKPGILKSSDPKHIERIAKCLVCDGSTYIPDWGKARFYGPISFAAILKDRNSQHTLLGLLANEKRRVAALESLPTQESGEGWQPIETAPKSTAIGNAVHGIYILGYCPEPDICNLESAICVVWWEPLMKKGKGMWYGEGGFEVIPTHWRPLPAPPAEPKGGG